VPLHELDYVRRPASDVERAAIVSLATQVYAGNGTSYYESVEYHVYRKLQGKWQEIYNNSFGGC
jgi:hypothetical protein